jgi:CubicO group peptidase (beta-lactamase class C family)
MKPTISTIFVLIFLAFSCKTEKPGNALADMHAIENGLLPAVHVKGDSVTAFNLQERMAHYSVPGLSLALVENGQLKWAKGYGIANSENGSEVGTTTLFQAASISKPLAALAILKLVENGILDLDEDVNTYLKDWKIPENNFTKEQKVTLRGLLTHTAGITVHGFPGYRQSDRFPTITEVLNGDGNTAKIHVDIIPGSIWRYSGGGYTIMEKIIEDQSGLSLDEYMSRYIFPEIGMENSTFQQPLGQEFHSHASAAYDTDGKIIEGYWHNYPEKAAAGLWTTPTDLAKYCIEIHRVLSGKAKGVLSRETIEMMLTKHQNDWGLGPSLSGEDDSLIFMHGGKNAGFTNNLVSFAHRGNALIIMTNADNGRPLISEIERAVSCHYRWGIRNQRIVETIQLPTEAIHKFAGSYKMADPMIALDFTAEGGKLIATGEIGRFQFIPMSDVKFIDLESGYEIDFQLDGDEPGFVLDKRFWFVKSDRSL